ncbi:hypothetical protein JY651_07270 [Pyxidicoccus parkwayensis]|jgi:hypothetical protein|uniref:Uncharacterized protein n=1 Tax=Pyxidicoccus parkwayensis TaxID=2813578 RepID=A0ABX7P2Q4_9BACT|nr:hypothetical protein [Pyxidicoccus parkwaysis]QSQ24738.1 hypothetical protein JY651_07270 [Pyxidicoccus parkwaysis]
MKRWRGLKFRVQDVVDKGATAVEGVHRRMAAVPFRMLRRIRPLDAPVRRLQELHDLALSTSYAMFRLANRVAGKTVDVALQVAERRSTRAHIREVPPPPQLPPSTQ